MASLNENPWADIHAEIIQQCRDIDKAQLEDLYDDLLMCDTAPEPTDEEDSLELDCEEEEDE